MWALDQIVVGCLAAIGIFTTTFSIIEPQPLLAISHQAHAIVTPIWYSFQRFDTHLELSNDIGLHDDNTTGVPHSVEGYTSDLPQPVNNYTSDSPRTVNGLLLLAIQDDLSAAESYTELVFTEQQPIHDDHFMLQYLLDAFGWICRHPKILVVVLCLAALCFVLLVPITVPQKSPVCNRIATSTQGLEYCLGSTPSEFAVPVEQPYESISVLNVSLYLQSANLEQELEVIKASKQNLQAELELMGEENANLQKEIAKTREYDAQMQAKSFEHSQKIKELENHVEVKNKDAEERAAKVISLSRDLTVQKQLLKVKAEECNDMDVKITAQFESNQSLRQELEATKASKEDVHAELMTLRQKSVTLQKEIASSKEHNAKVQAKSTEHGREMEALKCHIEAKNKDAAELTAKFARLSGDLTVQKQLLEIKAEECNDMEEKASAQFESNQSLKRELEGTKVQLSKNVESLKSIKQNYAELKRQDSSTKQALSTAKNENVALNASLTAKSDELCKSTALCKSTEQRITELKECEAATKDELESAQSQNRTLLASLAAESNKLCKCKQEMDVEHQEKLDIEQQLATLRKEKAVVEDLLMAASRDHSEAKELLLQAHEEEEIAIFEINFKDNALNFIHHRFAQYRADHQAQMNEWTATQNSLLLQADQSLRLRKAAEAKAAEAKCALLKLQADRANAQTTIAMISKRRSGSGQSTSTTSSHDSLTTSHGASSGARSSGLKPVLDVSAIIFNPQTSWSSLSAQSDSIIDTNPVHEHRVRKGRLTRQLRRPSKASRVAKPQTQLVKHVSLRLPSIGLHLPFGRHLITAKSMLDVTIWRLNDAALIGFHCSPNTLRESMVHFWCDISQLRSVSAARYQLYCLRQSAQMLFSNARMASLHIPASLKAVSGAISQAQIISTPPSRIMHAKASVWHFPATTPNESGHPIIVAAAEKKRSAPPLSSSMWATVASEDVIQPDIVAALEQKRSAPPLSSSVWATVASEDAVQPTVVPAPKEQSLAPNAKPMGKPFSSISALVARRNPGAPVSAVEPADPRVVHATQPANQVSLSRWAQVAPEDVIESGNFVTPGEQDSAPLAQATNELANSMWAQPAPKTHPAPKQNKSANILCKYFAKGRCRKGNACPYKH